MYHVRASQLGCCPRALAYYATGGKPPEPHSAQAKCFAAGCRFESYVVDQLDRIHQDEEVTQQQRITLEGPVDAEIYVSGHPDYIVHTADPPIIYEIKSMCESAYNEFVVYGKYYPEYLWQCSAYYHALGRKHRVVLLAVCKSTLETCERDITLDMLSLDVIHSKLQLISRYCRGIIELTDIPCQEQTFPCGLPICEGRLPVLEPLTSMYELANEVQIKRNAEANIDELRNDIILELANSSDAMFRVDGVTISWKKGKLTVR